MKKITLYQSEDGKTFSTEKEALERDKLLELAKLMDDDLWLRGISAFEVVEWLIERGLVKL